MNYSTEMYFSCKNRVTLEASLVVLHENGGPDH